jgi:hypothetical protein
MTIPQAVNVGDFDGDGDLDIVSANSNTKTLTIFFKRCLGSLKHHICAFLTGCANDPD